MDEKTKYRLIKSLIDYIVNSDYYREYSTYLWNEEKCLDYIADQVMLMLFWVINQGDVITNIDEVRSIALGEIHDEYWSEVTEIETIND